MADKNARVTKLLLWATLSDSHPVEDLQVFGCAFSEWYVSRLAHCEECETCHELYAALLHRALAQHVAVVSAMLGKTSLSDIRAALGVLPQETRDLDAAVLAGMPPSDTKH